MKIRFPALVALMLSAAAQAEDYPARPVHLVVPYVAGGNADIFGRTLAQKLGDAFRQPFIVENRAGANGSIGTDFVAKAAPDGYTLLATANGPITVNPVLYAKVPYDPVRDFAPVAQCVVYQYVLVTLAGSPVKSIADLVEAARARHPYPTHARPLQGQRARARRPAGRPAHFHVRHRHHLGSADPRRKVACVRGVEREARLGPPGGADHAGGRDRGLRHLAVAGCARAGR